MEYIFCLLLTSWRRACPGMWLISPRTVHWRKLFPFPTVNLLQTKSQLEVGLACTSPSLGWDFFSWFKLVPVLCLLSQPL